MTRMLQQATLALEKHQEVLPKEATPLHRPRRQAPKLPAKLQKPPEIQLLLRGLALPLSTLQLEGGEQERSQDESLEENQEANQEANQEGEEKARGRGGDEDQGGQAKKEAEKYFSL